MIELSMNKTNVVVIICNSGKQRLDKMFLINTDNMLLI